MAALRVFTRLVMVCILASGRLIYAIDLTVTATVEDTCQFGTITNTNFGTISGLFQTTLNNSGGSIIVTCTPTSDYTLTIDAGLNEDATSRRMTDSTDFIRYNLYQDSGFSTLWGDGTTFGNPVSDIGDGTPQTYTVYATIPAGQTPVQPGTYSDTVMVNFVF